MKLNEKLIQFMAIIETGNIGVIITELIRALIAVGFWMMAFYFVVEEMGWIDIPMMTSFYISIGLSALMFSVLVPLRIKKGLRLQLARFRYMLIVILATGIPIFIWRLVEGAVAQALIFAAVVVACIILLRMAMKRRGLE